jgi:hypothetical protein
MVIMTKFTKPIPSSHKMPLACATKLAWFGLAKPVGLVLGVEAKFWTTQHSLLGIVLSENYKPTTYI